MNASSWEQVLTEVDFRYSRSSGPGGQHVNRTETKVELRWLLPLSLAFTDIQKHRIETKLKNWINKEGFLIVSSDQFRARARNIQACQDRLKELLTEALKVQKKRRKTKPSKSSIKKRLDSKRRRSDTKKNRGKVKF